RRRIHSVAAARCDKMLESASASPLTPPSLPARHRSRLPSPLRGEGRSFGGGHLFRSPTSALSSSRRESVIHSGLCQLKLSTRPNEFGHYPLTGATTRPSSPRPSGERASQVAD